MKCIQHYNWKACGNSCYDEKTEDCCNGNDYTGNSWNDSWHCYDTQIQDCCGVTVFNGTSWKDCGDLVTMKD